MSSSITKATAIILIPRIVKEITELEDNLTVGNYFEYMDIINQKKAQLAALQTV